MACGLKRVTWIYSNQIYGINPKIGNNPKIFLETFLISYIWRNMLGLAGGVVRPNGEFPTCTVNGNNKGYGTRDLYQTFYGPPSGAWPYPSGICPVVGGTEYHCGH